MKKAPVYLLVLSALLIHAGSASAGNIKAERLNSNYIVGPGDILEVSVWKDEALSRIVTVLPDGKVSLPLIGEYMAMGKPIYLIRNEIKKKISRFVPDVELVVSVQQVNSMWVYVIGKVLKAGRFQLNGNINVLQALSMAGGFTPFADSSKIKIFREKKGKTDIFHFNYNDIARGKNLYANIHLEKGDVIVVP